MRSIGGHPAPSRSPALVPWRLSVVKELEGHTGCVNTVSFHPQGRLLVSGSDDTHLRIWDGAGFGGPPGSHSLHSWASGHFANIFSAVFVGEGVVSCAREGMVRHSELGSAGWVTRLLCEHEGSAHRLEVVNRCPTALLSCGEDGVVYALDLREPPSAVREAIKVRTQFGALELFAVSQCPTSEVKVAVGGADRFVRVYDLRAAKTPVQRLCDPVVDKWATHITHLKFTPEGDTVLAHYSGASIAELDTTVKGGSRALVARYTGHKNSRTVKQLNCIDEGRVVVTGSDNGTIFFYERNTGKVLHVLKADGRVVNCIAESPNGTHLLAACGIDDTVKLIMPSGEADRFEFELMEAKARSLATMVPGTQNEQEGPGSNLMDILDIAVEVVMRGRKRRGLPVDEVFAPVTTAEIVGELGVRGGSILDMLMMGDVDDEDDEEEWDSDGEEEEESRERWTSDDDEDDEDEES
jgi:WD repeat-containing protein 42A